MECVEDVMNEKKESECRWRNVERNDDDGGETENPASFSKQPTSRLTLDVFTEIATLVVRDKVVPVGTGRAAAVQKRKTSLPLGVVVPALPVVRPLSVDTVADLRRKHAHI